MKNVVAGTAGHIDHGKTALVRALTGVDTDRLKEEKERGISIDLGFAHLDLAPGLRLALIDVPGHEKFIKNMLAGVGGIDLVLFVIAANESIRPQTREHFDICRMLAIPRGVVALTKADLVDQDILDLVRLEVGEFVQGTFLESAPVVAVSSVTGAGLAELRSELKRIAIETREKDSNRYFRLPIDRAFSMRGFGTVATGTLISGAVRTEQEIEIHPHGRRARVRGIHVHGETVTKAEAGQRTALNLGGVEPSDLRRGMMAVEPGRFAPVGSIDCAFDLLPSAKPLRNRSPVHFHAGTAEVGAVIRSLESPGGIRPGTRAFVRLLLREPLQLLPGDRFIVRMFSPVTTIGGGVVLDVNPPRRSNAERLRTLETGTAAERIELLSAESKWGIGMPELVARTGLLESEITAGATNSGAVLALAEPQFWVISRTWVAAKLDYIQSALKQFHRDKPLLAGVSKEELRSRVLKGAPPFLLDSILKGSKTLSVREEIVHLSSHKVALKQDETDAISKIEAAFEAAGLAAPGAAEVVLKSGIESARARTLLQILLRDKKLVRINGELVFHRKAIESLRSLLAGRRGQRFAVPEFKEWTGVSRKYAIPLLEFLDREHVTRREGESRLVL